MKFELANQSQSTNKISFSHSNQISDDQTFERDTSLNHAYTTAHFERGRRLTISDIDKTSTKCRQESLDARSQRFGDTSQHEPHDGQTTHALKSQPSTTHTNDSSTSTSAAPVRGWPSHPTLHMLGTLRRPLHPLLSSTAPTAASRQHLAQNKPHPDPTRSHPSATRRASAAAARSHSAPRPTSRTASWDGGARPVALGGLQRAVSGPRMAANVGEQ